MAYRFPLEHGSPPGSVAEIERAGRVDPLSLVVSGVAGSIYSNARQYDQALARLRQTLELDPNFSLTYAFLARVYERQGQYERALDVFDRAFTLDGGNESGRRLVAAQRAALRVFGPAGYWRVQLQRGEDWRGRLTPLARAEVHAWLGNKDEALAWLERATREQRPGVAAIRNDSAFDRLRSEPRYLAILRRLNLPT